MDTLLQIMDILARPLMTFVVFLLVIFLVIRPAMHLLADLLVNRRRKTDDEEEDLEIVKEAAGEEELLELLRRAGPGLTDRDRIERLAKSDPDKAKQLVQAWIRDHSS